MQNPTGMILRQCGSAFSGAFLEDALATIYAAVRTRCFVLKDITANLSLPAGQACFRRSLCPLARRKGSTELFRYVLRMPRMVEVQVLPAKRMASLRHVFVQEEMASQSTKGQWRLFRNAEAGLRVDTRGGMTLSVSSPRRRIAAGPSLHRSLGHLH